MKNVRKQCALVVAMSLLVSQVGWASGEVAQDGSVSTAEVALMSSAFQSPPSSTVEILDEQAMSDTQGELLPWIIGVAALDLSLATFFWSAYVPTMAATGGLCVNCDIGTKSR